MKRYIIALAVLATIGLASCGSGSTESSTTTTDTTVVVSDTTNAVNDTTVKAIVADTTVK